MSRARLSARFENCNGVTRLANVEQRAPLKIAKTFAQSDGSLSAIIMDASPGLLKGDDYELRFSIGENARVHLSNQGFTRVHPSRDNGATLTQHVTVECGAWCELAFEPTLLYADANLQLRTRLEVARDGTLLMCEFWGAGRVARGETWKFAGLDARTTTTYDGQLSFVSNTRLQPERVSPRQLGGFGDATHWGSVLCVSENADAELRDTWRETLRGFPNVQSGASLTARNGVCALMLGRRAHDLQAAGEALRQQTRAFLEL